MDISFELILVFAVFWMLTIWTVKKYKERALIRNKSEWFIDILGLLQQGFLFPLIQTYLLFAVLQKFTPELRGIISINPLVSFLIQFVIIDYLYYWNHRLMHTSTLWPLHRVHHSAQKLDLWVTSRNSFWSSFFIIYLWIHAFFIFLLNDAKGFLLAIAIGNALDLWRHSGFRLPGKLEKVLEKFMVLPHHHEWHHSSTIYDKNFGANFILWDKWHGTFYSTDKKCEILGEDMQRFSFWNQCFFPWRLK
ncbi:sterol desaturase family protein [Bacteriovorax sp. PP10]|uniref:Sterol desaturase family protein n=1 Tax=Bacteriovorax antarcticus TaxID=3088717 RepID=A0ABU5VVB8_9BACT|nr:sterol desaturase family protein [Bacteriovorax sp. PP10]MEA9356991.1 sterol desaturase family protein [Bacteriovorax sp. PP10]